MYIWQPVTIMILQQNYIQTVVSLPVMNVLEKMQRLYLICFPDIPSRRTLEPSDRGTNLDEKPFPAADRTGSRTCKTGYIRRRSTAKMNSLCDPAIIAALYYASSCGVQIESAGSGYLLSENREYQVSVKISTCVRSLENFWNTAVFSISKMVELMKSIWEALTGCHEILTAVWKLYFR